MAQKACTKTDFIYRNIRRKEPALVGSKRDPARILGESFYRNE